MYMIPPYVPLFRHVNFDRVELTADLHMGYVAL